MTKEYFFQAHQAFIFLILRIICIRVTKFFCDLRHVFFPEIITLQEFFTGFTQMLQGLFHQFKIPGPVFVHFYIFFRCYRFRCIGQIA